MEETIYIQPHEASSQFTTYSFYNYLLPKVREHYNRSKSIPVFSIEKVRWINPLVIPNIIGLGYYLRTYHKRPIKLRITYEPHLLYYLTRSNFFKICGKRTMVNPLGLDIFDYNEDFLGGFSSYVKKEQRKEHKVHYYLPCKEKSEDMYAHDTLIESLSLFTLKEQFEVVLKDAFSWDRVNKSIECIAEPISNGILHSDSITWAISQTTPGKFSKTMLSIVDVGIGFEESFARKGQKTIVLNESLKRGIYKKDLRDFFFIMEAIYYSLIKKRRGLIDFIFDVAINGTVRIHYQSTQVLFTQRIIFQSTKLYECRQKIKKEYTKNYSKENSSLKKATIEEAKLKIFDLINILLNLQTNDKKYSSIRIYDIKFKGVHIEFQLNKD